MTDSVSYDYSDLKTLEADVGSATFKVVRNSQKAVQRTAHRVMEDAKKFATGLAHARLYPRSITYDMTYGLNQIGADIGPDKDRAQGALGNLLEYGSVNNAPWPHLGPAIQKNEPDFLDGLRKATDVL